jgi:c-di-GMP-binding flagellar brake protein YcgR
MNCIHGTGGEGSASAAGRGRSPGILNAEMSMKELALEVNDLLQIQIPDDPNSLSYRSRVDDIVQGRLLIPWPTDRGVPIPIHQNQTLTISFVRDDAVYTFSGIVEERKREPLALLWMRPAGPPERIQRRHFFRVKSVLQVEFLGEQASYDEADAASRFISIKSQTFDISGSGLSIRHGSSIAAGTLLDCKLALPDDHAIIKILCKVAHSERISASSEPPLYHIGMFYLSIKDADRTRVVRHVFKVEQANLLQ